MAKLLVHSSAPDHDGRIHSITPQSAGWGYVGFDAFILSEGCPAPLLCTGDLTVF
jgi:5-deoxy-glucuronate isomerase